jgi:hypothetical protein
LENIDSYWTLKWTQLLIYKDIKPFKIKYFRYNYPQVKVGDNCSIEEREGVSHVFIDIYGVWGNKPKRG